MPGEEKERRKWSASDPDEAAAAKLWGVYVNEADKYDEGLVDTWKKDMEGLLIFAGLFSAILTAFLIESYKSLSPDNTVQALSQISQQLAAAAAGTVSNIPSSPAFVPSVSSIVCNAFWFISLGLSLACALIATLVQQWARNFLHKTRLRSAPSLRAPIFMYFYFGLKRFGMHRVVEVIPLLLHMSLLLFFAGLVSFLIPVNTTLTVIAAVILAIVGGVYIGLTLLPLQWLDCPYHTPLSTTTWLVWKALQRTWLTRCHPAHGVELANRAAAGSQVQSPLLMKLMTVSNGPHRAWLARSGDAESAGPETTNPVSTGLESANAISTGPESFDSVHSSPSPVSAKTWLARCRTWFTRRHQAERVEPTFPYNPHPHPHHETMMKAMFHAAAEPSTERTGREYRALVWTMGSLADNSELEPFIQGIADVLEEPHERYEEHIRNLVRDHKVYLLDRIANLLDSCTTTILSPEAIRRRGITCYRALWSIASLLEKSGEAVDFEYIYSRPSFHSEEHYCISARAMMAHSTLIAVEPRILQWSEHTWRQVSSKFICRNFRWRYRGTPAGSAHALAVISSNLYLEFVATATLLKAPPYRWAETRAALTKSDDKAQGIVDDDLLVALDQAISTQQDTYNDHMAWFDESVLELLSFWPPMLDRIPHSVVHFLLRRPESAHAKNDVYLHIWRCLPRTLSQGVLWSSRARGFLREELLTAMWSATSFNARSHKDRSALSILQAAHEALSSAHFSPTEAPITRSIVSVLEFKMLHAMPWSFTTVGEALLSITHPLFPADTAVDIPEEIRNKGKGEEFEENPIWLEFLWAKKSEASFCVVAEYLQHCTSSIPPYNAAKTLKKIAVIAASTVGRIHPAHQARLAESICGIFEVGQASELMDAIIDCPLWNPYAEGHKTGEDMRRYLMFQRGWPWLQDPTARQKIRAVFDNYEGQSKERAVKISEGLRSWHPEEASLSAVAGEPARAEQIASSSGGPRYEELREVRLPDDIVTEEPAGAEQIALSKGGPNEEGPQVGADEEGSTDTEVPG